MENVISKIAVSYAIVYDNQNCFLFDSQLRIRNSFNLPTDDIIALNPSIERIGDTAYGNLLAEYLGTKGFPVDICNLIGLFIISGKEKRACIVELLMEKGWIFNPSPTAADPMNLLKQVEEVDEDTSPASISNLSQKIAEFPAARSIEFVERIYRNITFAQSPLLEFRLAQLLADNPHHPHRDEKISLIRALTLVIPDDTLMDLLETIYTVSQGNKKFKLFDSAVESAQTPAVTSQLTYEGYAYAVKAAEQISHNIHYGTGAYRVPIFDKYLSAIPADPRDSTIVLSNKGILNQHILAITDYKFILPHGEKTYKYLKAAINGHKDSIKEYLLIYYGFKLA